jgi:heme a synthase
VIGGVTVLTGLLWWTVAIHLLASMTMVWVSVLLYVKIGEPDEGTVTRQVPKPLRQLTFVSAAVLAAVLVTGTLVTGAGPHAGDKSIENPVPRLQVEIVTLVQLHATLLVTYLSLLVALVFALRAVAAPGPVVRRLAVLLAVVAAQALVGRVQYALGVPAALVAIHVAGAAACTAATAALWASMRQRTEAESLEGVLDAEDEVALPPSPRGGV